MKIGHLIYNQIKAYLARYGINADDTMTSSIRETCLSDPATYIPYTSGLLKMNSLREKTEKTLGKKFSAKKFHTFLLDLGPCQFNILDDHFDAWLKKQI